MSSTIAGNNSDPNRSPDPKPGSHILVFLYPALGHMLPLLDLSHQLCLRRVTVTILVTPKNLPYLSPLLSTHPTTASAFPLPFPPHPSLTAGVENVKDIGNAGNLHVIAALSHLDGEIVNWFNCHPNPPKAIISDFFLGWTNDLGRRINIPRFAFFPSGAFASSLLDFCWNNVESVMSKDPFQFSDLPSAPLFREEHLPTLFRRYVRSPSSPELDAIKHGMLANMSSYGCVFNSFGDLEGEYFAYLKRKMGHDRVFAVGPISLTGLGSSGGGRAESDPDLDSCLLAWLDGCPDGSVLYVCFGSQMALTKEQAHALALALEKRVTRFIWVVKNESIPEGLEKRVMGRGVIIRRWAPQTVLLGHRAVGGFLSHCGWNSVVEAISGRAMILAWPMEADQFVNAKLLVEHMGIAVRVCEGSETVPDPDVLGRSIAEAMGQGGLDVKTRAEEMSEKATAAVQPGGSSFTDLARLVKGLCVL